MARKLVLTGFMSSLLLVSIIAYSLPAFAQGPDFDQGKPEVIAVSGITPKKDMIVHILVLVPPGADRNEVAAAALAQQGARPFTSDEFSTIALYWDQYGDSDAGNDKVIQNYNPKNDPTGNQGFNALNNTHTSWNNVTTSNFTFEYGSDTNRCPSLVKECKGPQKFDGHNDVAWLRLSGSGILGVTWTGTSTDEADMALNTNFNWETALNASPFDVETVFLHENGHVAGLGHSNDINAIMYPSYQKLDRDLSQDDIDGITYLYPNSSIGASPTVSISSPVNDSEFATGTTINFTGSALDVEDGNMTSNIVWTSSIDDEIGTGGSFSKVLTDGTHTITASVTDDDGNTSTDSVTVTIVPTTPTPTGTVSVSFDWAGEGGKDGKKHLLSTVNLGTAAAGSTVNVHLTNSNNGSWTGSGTTGSDGSVTFSLKNAPKSMYTIEVTAINGNPTSEISTPPYSNS